MKPVEEGEVRLNMDEVAQLKPISDYTAIYSVIKRFDKRHEGDSLAPYVEVVGVSTAGENEVTKQDETIGENEVAEQDESVVQGDVVASDGTYVCRIRSQASKKVDIAKIEKDGKLVKGKVMDCDVPEELYVRDGMLILCSSIYTGTDGRDFTNIYFYDIRNPKEPKLLEQRCQTGYYCTSQIKDGYLYVVSYDKPYGYFEEGDAGTYVPEIDYEVMEEERIFRREGCIEYSYGVMTSIDLSAPEKYADVAAVWTGVTEAAIGEDGYIFLTMIVHLPEFLKVILQNWYAVP